MALLFTLWVLSVIIASIVFVLRYLLMSSPPTPLAPNDEPPNPGGFDSRKYPTREMKEAWIKAYTARVEWERAQPKKIIPPLPDQTTQKWRINLKARQVDHRMITAR